MANELIIRNGLIVLGPNTVTGNEIVTGSLTVLGAAYLTASQAITSSYSFYAVTSSYSLTSSYIVPNPSGLLVVGSITASNIFVSGNIEASSVTASIQGNVDGTASYAINAGSANTAISASYASQAGNAQTSVTASYALQAGNSQTAVSASYASQAGNAQTAVSASYVESASYAVTASYAGHALTASYVEGLNGHTASYAWTASWAINALTASNVDYAGVTGITSTSQFAGTASYATTAEFVVSASHANQADSANVANTASYVVWANVDESNTDTFAGTASYATKAATAITANTASYVDYTNVKNITSTSTFAGTASYATTAGTADSVTWDNVTSKPYVVSQSAQLENGGGIAFSSTSNVTFGQITASAIQVTDLYVINITSSVIYSSGSNKFGSDISNIQQMTGSVRITGSLTVVGPINGNLTGTASYATFAQTASYSISSSYLSGSVVASSYTQVQGGLTSIVQNVAVTGVASATPVESFNTGSGYAAKWFVSARDGVNYRSSEVMAAWSQAGSLIAFTEFSTADVGDTSPLTMSVDISGANVRLVADPSSGNWEIRATRILI